MKKSREFGSGSILPITVLLAILIVWSNLTDAANANRNREADHVNIARGKYLVEEVARCPECHTPRDAKGDLDTQAWLEGAPIWIMPVHHIQNWADTVPPIAGLGSLTDAQMARVLEQGTGPEGEALRPPMHTYHMSHADAQAVIEYLKSLPAKAH